MNEQFARRHNLPTEPLIKPLPVYNVDGTPNQRGRITHFTRIFLRFGDKWVKTRFLLTALGKEHIILGLPWLRQHNPRVNWVDGTIDFPQHTPHTEIRTMKPLLTEDPDDEATIRTLNPLPLDSPSEPLAQV